MSDRQCSSCGGFCGRGGCKRENVKSEQEPVAWLSEGGDVSRSKRYMDEMGFICEPLYTAPPARKPLSDERIDHIIASNVTITDPHLLGAVYMAIREVEAAHGIGD